MCSLRKEKNKHTLCFVWHVCNGQLLFLSHGPFSTLNSNSSHSNVLCKKINKIKEMNSTLLFKIYFNKFLRQQILFSLSFCFNLNILFLLQFMYQFLSTTIT